MIIRLCLNKTELQRREDPLSPCQRQADHPGRIFVRPAATANLINAIGPSAPISSNMPRRFILNPRYLGRAGP